MPERLAGPPVKPEFRPTLPELVGPRLRAWGPVGAALALLALLVLLVVLARGSGAATQTAVVREPVAFNLVYDADRLERVTPPSGASLLLRTRGKDPDPESFTVRPITLPAYQGDPAGVEPIVAAGLIARMRRADPAFVLR